MAAINDVLRVLLHYVIEVLPSLAAGFLLSGIIHEFIPTSIVEKHLGGKGIKPLLYATIVGTILPICCVGSLPVALSLHKKGARIGSVVSFLIATPATSLSALFVTYSLLGLKFAAFIFFAVIIIGIIIGAFADLFKFRFKKSVGEIPSCCSAKDDDTGEIDPVCKMVVSPDTDLVLRYDGRKLYFCNANCMEKFKQDPEKYLAEKESHGSECCDHDHSHKRESVGAKILSALRFAFWEMPKDIGVELIIGMILAAIIASFDPLGLLIERYLGGFWGYPFSLVVGLLIYVCSTASVPMAHALVSQGMNIGAAMLFLIVGPVTSWGSILVIRKQFGGRMLVFYLLSISMFSLLAGYIFSLI